MATGRGGTITAIGAITITAMGAITIGGISVADTSRRLTGLTIQLRLRSSERSLLVRMALEAARPSIRKGILRRLTTAGTA
jgi:hypothetical protein